MSGCRIGILRVQAWRPAGVLHFPLKSKRICENAPIGTAFSLFGKGGSSTEGTSKTIFRRGREVSIGHGLR